MNVVEVKRFDDENVWKYVFYFENAIAEAVLYRYESFSKRTVMCVSVQSGCPVGCIFCGTGKKFIRNLTNDEIKYQVMYLVNEAEKMEFISYSDLNTLCEKFQIMFMSMGEPLLNIDTVISSIHELHHKYTNAQLLISTIGINNQKNLQQLLTLSINIDKVGLQFSIHDAFDEDRDKIIPYRRKLNLREIRDYAIEWNKNTHRPVFLNYCVTDKNITCEKINRLMDLFSPKIFNFTFSVICEKEKGKKTETDMNLLYDIQTKFLDIEYNVRIFDPAGKDTIGGGCGQLHETQEYFKTYDK